MTISPSDVSSVAVYRFDGSMPICGGDLKSCFLGADPSNGGNSEAMAPTLTLGGHAPRAATSASAGADIRAGSVLTSVWVGIARGRPGRIAPGAGPVQSQPLLSSTGCTG